MKVGATAIMIYQGTAMGRPSQIQVEIGSYSLEGTTPNPSLKVSYTGLVVFDAVSFSDLAKKHKLDFRPQ